MRFQDDGERGSEAGRGIPEMLSLFKLEDPHLQCPNEVRTPGHDEFDWSTRASHGRVRTARSWVGLIDQQTIQKTGRCLCEWSR